MAKGLVIVSEYAAGAGGAAALHDGRQRQYAERLEEGYLLLFEQAPFPLPDAAGRAALMGVRQASAAYHKNISFRPGEDRVKGIAGGDGDAEAVRTVLRDYSRNTLRLLTELFPFYAARWTVDFASFRPVEEQGRQLSLRARNDLIHVDAFPTRPTNGGRMLLAFHHYLKADAAFQTGCPKHRWEFPPGSTWIALTDMVPHAVESGRFGLEQTVIVPREALVRPDLAPIAVLERLCHVPLSA
jgi:hypothetical protein